MQAIQNKPLTYKEQKVLDLIKNGLTSVEISEHMHISVNTVANHRANIVKKLNLFGPNALLKYVLHT